MSPIVRVGGVLAASLVATAATTDATAVAGVEVTGVEMTRVAAAEASVPSPHSTVLQRVIRPARSETFIIGDSTLKRVTPKLSQAQPDWYLDYQEGRPISALPARMNRYLKSNPAPANFVMALGTNHSDNPPWSYERLEAAIDKLPADTNVFLLLVIRAGSRQHWKDVTLQKYNGYSRRLAEARPNTYLLNWRHLVLSDPTLKEHPVTGVCSLLEDGTHQTGSPYHLKKPGPGVDTWIDMVVSKVQAVNGASMGANAR